MKHSPVIFFSFILIALSHYLSSADEEDAWRAFKNKHRKMFRSRIDEENRKLNFFKNKIEVDAHNDLYELGVVSYKQEQNIFSDMVIFIFKCYAIAGL